MNRTENEVRNKVFSFERGRVFFPSDFEEIASPEAIRQTLSRMVKCGDIIRISKGVYCFPRSNKMLGLDVIPPSSEEVAARIAERDKVKIIPTGDMALNQLGISTQIPGNAVYITNGAKKNIKLNDGRSIVFRESNEFRLFDFISRTMMLAVSAIRSIGEENLLSETLNHIKKIISNVPKEEYRHDLMLAPVWVRKKLED